MEQGPDFWCLFDTTQFSYHCVHPIHAKMFSIQMLLHFSQIVTRVCTLVLFIIIITSACGHELSRRVRAHPIKKYDAWAECTWVASKLLIIPLSE